MFQSHPKSIGMDRGDPETLGHTNGFLGMVRLVNHHKPTKTSGLVDFQGMFFVRHATWVTFETKNKKNDPVPQNLRNWTTLFFWLILMILFVFFFTIFPSESPGCSRFYLRRFMVKKKTWRYLQMTPSLPITTTHKIGSIFLLPRHWWCRTYFHW